MASSLKSPDLAATIQWLRSGKMVAYPTETVYGLGVNALDPKALARLRELKGRPEGKPFPLLLPTPALFPEYADEVSPEAKLLAKKFWPGALTLIVPASRFSEDLRGPSGGVGFRVSDHPVAKALAEQFGKPMTTTSANPSGKIPAATPEEVRKMFHHPDLMVLDAGPATGLPPSTVIDCTKRPPELLREGAIPWDVIVGALEKKK